ncbi:MAG: D-glucuronyl C5-epimerase family protein, partial [Actinomycetota bacterium]|nr:D-glucuronyl C5-epimerase family protein [Actinomycetota bacterium]
MMGPRHFRLLAAVAAMASPATFSGSAQAEQVILVDGERAQRVDDPFVPSSAQVDLGPPPGSTRAPAYPSSHGPRTVGRVLRQAQQSGAITRPRYEDYRRSYGRARSTWRRLDGARKAELGYVLRSLERVALARRMTPSRMPVMFLQLRRNSAYWSSKPFPAAGDEVAFRGSELLFRYFPGRGLQFHPLGNFKKANLLHGACGQRGRGRPVCGARPPGPPGNAPCRPGRLRRLLDELSTLAVRRGGGFIAWEYMFDFGGGSPPWMSGMAQATGIAALGKGAQLLNRPAYIETAQAALGAFEARAPLGVSTGGPLGGVHYLQYSFAPRLYIFNAFLQSLIGLHDYGRLARDPRATSLFRRAEPEAQREVSHSDVGDWSRYSFRGRESTHEYHELLREVLQGLGRRLGGIYCDYAIRYRGYQTQPPVIRFGGPPGAVARRDSRVSFTLSKLSLVELKIYKGDRLALRRLATFRRGSRSFGWR